MASCDVGCRSQVKEVARRHGVLDSNLAPAVSFASGALAGAAATAASYPFDLLRTTLAAQGEPKVSHRGVCIRVPSRV